MDEFVGDEHDDLVHVEGQVDALELILNFGEIVVENVLGALDILGDVVDLLNLLPVGPRNGDENTLHFGVQVGYKQLNGSSDETEFYREVP